MSTNCIRIDVDRLYDFVVRVFRKLGVPEEDARIAADVLVQADLRGVGFEGVSKLLTHGHYVSGLQDGSVNPRPNVQIVSETPSTALLNGDGGLGVVVGSRAMRLAIRKAKATGAAFVTVGNSHHIGMAAYYAMLAMQEDMIGIAMSNSVPEVAPTCGVEPVLGANPIAIAAPGHEEPSFVLDMATSVVCSSKLEMAARDGRVIPAGWAINRRGEPITDPLVPRSERALVPLGGTLQGGSHKGYGLGVVVDILCGVLSGAGASSQMSPGVYGQFFAAIDIPAFHPVHHFTSMMDEMTRRLHSSKKATGHDRIYIPGEQSNEAAQMRRTHGIPLHSETIADLKRLSQELYIPYDLELPGSLER